MSVFTPLQKQQQPTSKVTMNHLVVLLLVVWANFMLLSVESASHHQDAESAGSSTSEKSDTSTSSEEIPEGASRAGYGIPTDPHPGVKTIFRPPHEERDSFKMGGVYQHTITGGKRDPYNHFFMGQAVHLDEKHVLMDTETWTQIGHYSNPKFNIVDVGPTPKEIDVTSPLLTHHTWQRHQLFPKNKRLNQTDLRVFELDRDFKHRDYPSTSVKLETNTNEFGKDCYVHGYGQVHPDYVPGASQVRHGPPNTEAFYASTKRQYVKMPLKPTESRGCKSTNTCSLSTTDRFNFCPSSGSGSPVYCGQDQKLTYMAAHSTNVNCTTQFKAYHIPRLIDDMDLPGLKSDN